MGGQCSWFDFATAIAGFVQQKYGSAARIEPCSSAQYPRPAQRPAYSVLDVAATIEQLGPLPDWRHNLQQVLETLEPHAAAGSAAPR
ncbi:MAG: sugar nucleotide-binding protein [Phycisphaerales bacterium]|nr:sugar nucleotide-binding protein [Phycisphaerales bacterium]